MHILDIMPMDETSPVDNYKKIRKELLSYSKALGKKKEIIVLNKIDLDSDGEIVKKIKKKLRKRVLTISAATGKGIKELSETLFKSVQKQKESSSEK